MKRGIDTHVMAARQILLWAAPGGELARLADATLTMPRFFLQRATELGPAVELVGRVKIEVAVIEEAGARADVAAVVRGLRAIDPHLEVVLLADRRRLGEQSGDETVDVLGLPCAPLELLRRVELARERRYLRRSEQRAKGVEARMSAVVRSVPTGLVSIDGDGVVHDWNPASQRIFGFSDLDALGRNLWELIGVPASTLTAEGGAPALGVKVELTARHATGRAFPIELSLASFALPERKMFCAIIEDRTQAKRLESELAQAQKLEAVGQLAAGLAHEINTPCQYIADHAAYVEAAVRDLAPLVARYRALLEAAAGAGVDGALVEAVRSAEAEADLDYGLGEVPESIASIKDGVRRVSEIVRAMRTFARSDWDNLGELDLNDLLRNILTVVASEATGVAEIETDLEPLPAIVGHGGDLNQALFNIVRNALEAMAPRAQAEGRPGKLTVRSRREDDRVAIAVGDTGAGIPAAIRGRIFEPFFTTKDVGRGPGQGLAVAWTAIVEKHGGRITFDTEEGAGTTFYVRLPIGRR